METSIKIVSQKGELSHPMTIAKPNRKKKDFLFFLSRVPPMRGCHNSANVKPLYSELSISPVDSLLSPPNFLFPF